MRFMNTTTEQIRHDDAQAANAPGGDLTTYYNGACPVCRTEVEHYKGIDARRGLGLGWHDVSQGVGPLAAHGLDRDSATKRLYAIDEGGRLHGGVDAFIQVWRRLPRYRWLARVVAAPGGRQIAGAVYEGVLAPVLYRWNRWRHRRGRA
jgi:predicted DCC family thiol-disulfide oxidoreductase YuxK